MISAEPKFITGDDYYNYWGVDLYSYLKDEDNVSNKVNIFLRHVETRLLTWIDSTTYRLYDWDELNEFQLEKLQLALLYQAKYMLRNGDTGLDSGYDPDKGPVVTKNYLDKIEICTPALDFLTTAGLNNHSIKNRKRKLRKFF